MNEYDQLWKWISGNGTDSFKLTYSKIEEITGLPIDYSFLNLKKELSGYGYRIGEMPMKEKTVALEKVKTRY